MKEKIETAVKLLYRKYVILWCVRWSCGSTSRVLFSVYERENGELRNHKTIELVLHESDSLRYIKNTLEYEILKKLGRL